MQFGTVGDKGMGFMDDAIFTKHVKVMSGLPSPLAIYPTCWGVPSTNCQNSGLNSAMVVVVTGSTPSGMTIGGRVKLSSQPVSTVTGKQWALTFAVNNNKLYQTYKFGQKVAVYASDLREYPQRSRRPRGTARS